MLTQEFVEETINRYIDLEKEKINMVNELDGNDGMGSQKWKLKKNYNKRIDLLKELKYDLIR